MDFDRLFSIYWAVATDIVLIAAGLVFVLRLYIVELRLERGLPGYYAFDAVTEAMSGSAIAADERWFLADDPDAEARQTPVYRRLRRLRKLVQLLSLLIIALAIFLVTGLVSAATATGELGISVVVLSRCIVQYVNSTLKASSLCSDSTAPTYTVASQAALDGSRQASINQTPNQPAIVAAPVRIPDGSTVTLTY
jgi:hypothetical protein